MRVRVARQNANVHSYTFGGEAKEPCHGRAGEVRSAWRGVFFFFQAEDGIRDLIVTGVQTCALPICSRGKRHVRGDGRADDQVQLRGSKPRHVEGLSRSLDRKGGRRLVWARLAALLDPDRKSVV